MLSKVWPTRNLHCCVTETFIELDANVGTDRLPNWIDVGRLPYCQALISELHRWAPIANVGKGIDILSKAGY